MDHRIIEDDAGTSQRQNGATESGALRSPPPASAQETSAAPTAVSYRAGFWLRLIAFTIDLVVLSTFSFLLLLTGLLVSVFRTDLGSLALAAQPLFSLHLLAEVAELLATAAYFTILHGETGQTIGKSLLGLEVCTVDGERLGYSRALIRFLGYWLSFFSFGLGFLWVAINPGKRGWHDLLAGTMVIVKQP